MVQRNDENNNNNVCSLKGNKAAFTRIIHKGKNSHNDTSNNKKNNNNNFDNDDDDDDDINDNCTNDLPHSDHVNDKVKKGAMNKQKMSISSCTNEVNDDSDWKRRS